MPNNVITSVEIAGPKNKIKKLIKDTKIKLEEGENEFDFNGIIKTPDNIFQGNLGQEEREKYGKNNWYDWNTSNWGTKWNAYDVKYIAHDDNHLVIEITTAWDTPRLIWDKLESMGFEINGIVHGEVDQPEDLGNGGPFYASLEVEYEGGMSSYTGKE